MKGKVDDPAVDLLVDCLRVYSPSTREEKLSKLLQRRMRQLGFREIRSDRAGNAIGVMGSEGGKAKPHLLLCGHMDTIPGMLKVRPVGGRVYGRGAVDAKSAMCAMISAASQLNTDDLRITMACVTREEGDSLGVNTLIDEGEDYDCAVFGEPGGSSRVAVGYRGRVEGNLTVRTSGGHAASSWAHPSAIEEAMSVLSLMHAYEKEHTADQDHYRSVNITLTMLRGGSYSNVVPDSCEATIDVRIPPGLTSKRVQSSLRKIVRDHARTRDGVELRLAFEEPTEPYDAPTDSLVVRAFQRSILKNLSSKPILTRKTGTGDMNTMAQRMGIPCVTYGPGDSRLEHTDGEYVEVSDYLDSIRVLRGVFSELVALRHSSG